MVRKVFLRPPADVPLGTWYAKRSDEPIIQAACAAEAFRQPRSHLLCIQRHLRRNPAGLPQRKVTIKEILLNDSTRLSDESSLLITDIIVELEDGTLANIEVQKIGYAFPGARCACYSSDMLLRQYKRVRQRSIDPATGKDTFSYRSISKVYLIVLYEDSPAELKQCPDHWIHRSRTIFDTGSFFFICMAIIKKDCHISLSDRGNPFKHKLFSVFYLTFNDNVSMHKQICYDQNCH